MTNDRPSALSDARVSIAYAQWLAANSLDDSDTSAWRFIAETRTPKRPRRRAVWIVASAMVIIVLAAASLAAYGVLTAEHWSRIVEPEVTKNVSVPDGTWTVSMDTSKPVCYDGQYASACAISLAGEWTLACDERTLNSYSQSLCDAYFESVQTFKEDVAEAPLATLEGGSDGVGKLTSHANTRIETVVIKEAVRRDAVCYFNVLGECPSSED